MASTNALTAREAYARDTCAAMLTESADARVQWLKECTYGHLLEAKRLPVLGKGPMTQLFPRLIELFDGKGSQEYQPQWDALEEKEKVKVCDSLKKASQSITPELSTERHWHFDKTTMDGPQGMVKPSTDYNKGEDTRFRHPFVGGNHAKSHWDTHPSD